MTTKPLIKTPSLDRPWEKLYPRERDAWIAEALMGYPEAQNWTGPMKLWHGDPCWKNAGGFPATCPKYTADPAAAFEMEEAVKEKGLADAYVKALRDVLFYRHHVTHDEHFAFVHATAAQRAEAVYLMLTRGKGNDSEQD